MNKEFITWIENSPKIKGDALVFAEAAFIAGMLASLKQQPDGGYAIGYAAGKDHYCKSANHNMETIDPTSAPEHLYVDGCGLGTYRCDADERHTIRYSREQQPDAGALVSALEELIELQGSALTLDARANAIHAPEDAHIKQLCEIYGYGAVMDSAARQWHLREGLAPKGSGLTTYHNYSVVKKATEQAEQALANFRGEK